MTSTEAIAELKGVLDSEADRPERIRRFCAQVWGGDVDAPEEVVEVLRDAAYDLEFYVKDPRARAESAAYYGDTQLRALLVEVLDKLTRTEDLS